MSNTINTKSTYGIKRGESSVGSPKVFFKYFYVDTATEEKSGEMMSSAELAG